MIALGYKAGNLVLQIEKATITQADADYYAGSIDSLTLGDGSTLTPSAPPGPDPIEPVVELFTGAVEAARARIILLKAQCLGAMTAYADYTRDAATAEGVRFATSPAIKDAISSYEIAGGHPDAAVALLAAVAADDSPWLARPMGEGGPPIRALFAAVLS